MLTVNILLSSQILSIILIILVATQWFFEASQAFGIIVNSLTLLSCFFHIFVKVTELDKLVSSHALVIAVVSDRLNITTDLRIFAEVFSDEYSVML